jgi:hypothetical protein
MHSAMHQPSSGDRMFLITLEQDYVLLAAYF